MSGGDAWVREAFARSVPAEQFVLEVQPVIRISTGEVWGAETFIRWDHPERGRVGPLEWIPVAAATGAIVDVTLRAVDEVARVAAQLDGPVLSLNVDGRLLGDERFGELIERAAAGRGRLATEVHHLQFAVDRARDVQPEHHWVEVDDLADRLAQLRSAGVPVWLDDLGDDEHDRLDLALPTVDLVKLDKAVLGRPVDELARLVAGLRAAGKGVVVEGVETEDDEVVATGAGIDLAQGFRYALPSTLDDFGGQWEGGSRG